MSADRVKKFGEVFTPPELVNEILDKLPKEIWADPDKKWLDPTCGDGVFLREIKKRLLKHHKESHILKNMLFGVDIQEDNIFNCIKHLYRVRKDDRIQVLRTKKDIRDIKKECGYKGEAGIRSLFLLDGRLIRNFVCADGLIYQYNFGTEEDISPLKGANELQNRLQF